MIQYIRHKANLLAIIIQKEFKKEEGIEFFTPTDFSQQLGYMSYKKGKIIEAHTHKIVKREILYTKEVLFIRKGKVRVDFYKEDTTYIKSYILNKGDIILLAHGGHGFEVLEDCEIIEVKQGPYTDDNDKIKFNSSKPQIILDE